MRNRILISILTLSVSLVLGRNNCLAALAAGSIRGTVTGPDGKPMGGVPLVLRNDITGFKAQAVTEADGKYSFFNVPFNPYELHVEVQGFATQHLAIDVRSTAPIDQPVTLALESVTATVKVEAEKPAAVLETDSSQSHVDIDKSFIEHAPAATPSRGMEALVIQAPGFSADENGRYHFQGAHSQQSYVVDGQPITDQIGTTFSNSIDPGILQSAEVIYGNVPAEYGEKIAAVINLTTKSGLGTGGPHGDVHAGGAKFGTYDAGASVGGGSDTLGYFGSVDGSKSDRFLDPVNFDNFHNHGDTERAFLRLDRTTPGGGDSFRLSGLIGRTNRDVTNTLTQQAADTDNTVETTDWNANLGWQHVFGSTTVLDTTLFARNNRFTYRGSPNDPSVITSSKRSLDNYGVQPTLSIQVGNANELKFGAILKSYPIQERFSFGITDPNLNDPSSPDYNPNLAPYDLTRGGAVFRFEQSKTVTYLAGFAEDTIRLGNLTAQIGLRYDHNSFPLKESQLEPRVGVSYFISQTKSVFRASYNRIFETPEYENILFSSSEEAAALAPPDVQQSRALGDGLLFVPSERQDAYDLGLQQQVGPYVRLDVDFWRRDSKFAGDQDQFQNTGIVFPLAFSQGKLHGWNVRLDSAPIDGFRGYLSVGHTRAIYVPPLAGGLFLDSGALDAVNGGPFVIDHDEKLQIQGGLNYAFGSSGFWAAAMARYDSGLVTGADQTILQDPDNAFAYPYINFTSNTNLDPNRIKPRTIWNFSAGADLTRYGVPVSLQVDLLNAFDKKGVYNVLSTFGGTHVIPPRTLAARVKYTF
ncbi:MAG: TonB-dependent receptor [Thermoanaerobaculia bacterium]